MKLILKYLRPYSGRMAFGFAIKFIGSIMDLFIPMLLSVIIDDIVPTGKVREIYLAGLLMLVCSLIAIAGNIIANRMAARVARNSTEKLRNDLFSKISYLSARQLDEFTIPSLESRLTSDTYNIHQFTGMVQRLGVRAPLLLLGGIIVAFIMEPVLTLVLVGTLPLIVITVFFVTKKGIPLYNRQQVATDGMTRIVREDAQGIRVIKALGREESEKDRFAESNATLNATEKAAAFNMAKSSPILNLLLNLGLVAVIIVGAIRVNSGESQVGEIIAFTSYFTIILNAAMSVTRIFIMSSRGIASANRIKEVLECPADMVCTETDRVPVPGAPKIEFSHVTFSYNGIKPDIDDVSFFIESGKTLGIIGPTGSGKTTLIALLMRQYDTDSGEVLVDGVNVRNIGKDELSEKFGAAFQNDFLFADTIRTNIDFGRGLTDEELLRAAGYAQASEVIEGKGGLDYNLTIKGANLSGGQKQRIILSRAFAADPEILVLDDSSSALDYATDAKLRAAIRENFSSRTTCVIVTQRVSSIMNADHILVMDDGKIIGQGTHAGLLETCALYREISQSQIGGALLE